MITKDLSYSHSTKSFRSRAIALMHNSMKTIAKMIVIRIVSLEAIALFYRFIRKTIMIHYVVKINAFIVSKNRMDIKVNNRYK